MKSGHGMQTQKIKTSIEYHKGKLEHCRLEASKSHLTACQRCAYEKHTYAEEKILEELSDLLK